MIVSTTLRPVAFFIALVLFVAPAVPTSASTPSDLCTGNPCEVNANVTLDAGSQLDFGGRELRFKAGRVVRVGPGALPRTLVLTAASIVLEPGARILGNGDRAEITLQSTSGSIELQTSGSNRSEINADAGGVDAGAILLDAAGDALVRGILSARAQGEDATGGSISILATGRVETTQEINASAGGSFAGGGEVSIVADGDVSVLARLSTEGSDFGGGDVSLTSVAGNVTIDGLILLSGGNPDGEAGELEVKAGTDIVVATNGEIRGRGGSGADDDCGDGAPISLQSEGSTIVRGAVNIGGGAQCFGGDFEVVASLDFLQEGTSVISTSTGGEFGSSGGVFLSAGRNATLRQIDGSGAGFGADIQVGAAGAIAVQRKVNARATGSFGVGGRIEMSACSIDVPAGGGELDARGGFVFQGFGENVLKAGGPMTIAGVLQASARNLLLFKTVPPVVSGAVTPAAVVVPDATLADCSESCGDGTRTDPEVCDDGNLLSCDGCSSSCLPDRVCGDGIQECGEQCDDGNLVAGDGCEPDCTPTGQDVEGVRIRGVGKLGCQLEWLLQHGAPATDKRGLPRSKQSCIDGDFECDADGVVNQSCTFLVAPCANVADEGLEECDPLDPVERITIKKPLPGDGNDPANLANAEAMLDSLRALGTTIIADGVTLQSGPPVSGVDVCGPSFETLVPFQGKSGRRKIRVRTDTVGGKTLKSAQLRLQCLRNDAICGNDVLEAGEICDDGNRLSCDGCSSSCSVEACGNGLLECGEQCDDGARNGTAESRCSLQCTRTPPELRLRGSGSKKADCMMQWSVEMDESRIARNKRGDVLPKQSCTAGDPACDLSDAPGCQMDFWACFGAANPELACSATSVTSVEGRLPRVRSKTIWELAARGALQLALDSVSFPAGPGEVCSNVFRVDIPRGKTLALGAKAYGAAKDSDTLKIRCE